MPLHHAGLGLRASSRVAHIAFLAALAALMPLTAFNPHFLAWADLEDILRTLHNFLPDLKKTLKARTAKQFHSHFHKGEQPHHLQRHLTTAMETKLNGITFQRLPEHLRALRLSASGPHASAWLTAIPVDHLTRMSAEEFRLACRLRLGKNPVDDPEALPITCPNCSSPLRADPWHPLSCIRWKKSAIYRRHNATIRPLQLKAGEFYGSCIPEPKGLTNNNTKPDLLISFGGSPPIVVEESITHPLAKSYVVRASAEPLSAARAREQQKRRKYERALPPDMIFVPAVQETLGALGAGTTDLIRLIAERGVSTRGIPANVTSLQLTQQLGVAIQIGNARTMMLALAYAHHDQWQS
jgi:hypothetical protein